MAPKSLVSVFLPGVSLCQLYRIAPQPARCGYVSRAGRPIACPKSSLGMDGVRLNFQVKSAPTLPLRFRNSGPTLHRARAGRETAMQATAAFAPQRPSAARCSPPGLGLAELGPVGLRSGTARQKKAALLSHQAASHGARPAAERRARRRHIGPQPFERAQSQCQLLSTFF